jgi:uncharacterized protein YqgV (UPF0045/DUF77 family)
MQTMTVQAEISLYPLRTPHLSQAVDSFTAALRDAGLKVATGTMSSLIEGDADALFTALGHAFSATADRAQVVLVLKVSNACPVCATRHGGTADAR